jgi:hypothetical protein
VVIRPTTASSWAEAWGFGAWPLAPHPLPANAMTKHAPSMRGLMA